MNEFVKLLFYQWLPQIVGVAVAAGAILVIAVLVKFLC
jgi:hypothetical protein